MEPPGGRALGTVWKTAARPAGRGGEVEFMGFNDQLGVREDESKEDPRFLT